MNALVAKRGGGGEILIKRMLYLKIIECIGCQERGGGEILIKRMLDLKIIESIGCQEGGGKPQALRVYIYNTCDGTPSRGSIIIGKGHVG